MFVKIGVDARALATNYGNFSIVIHSTKTDQATILRFDEITLQSVKEDIFEVVCDETFTIAVHFDDPKHFLETRIIEVAPAQLQMGKGLSFELSNEEQLTVTIQLSVLDRIPENWFEKGLGLLGDEPRPWYLKAEDVYAFLKYIVQNIQLPSSVPTYDELCSKIDFFARQIAKKYLSITVDDGFSIMSWIDSTLETLFRQLDESLDSFRFRLVLSLQKLRKEVTLLIAATVSKLQEKNNDVRQHVQTMMDRNVWISDAVSNLLTTLRTTTESATQWVTHEKEDVAQALALIQETSTATLAQAQATLLGVPTAVYHRVSDEVSHRIDGAQSSLLQIPVTAHPYVVNAVGVTQPYVSSVLTTATPYVESLVKAPLVENLILDTREALERNDNVNTLVQKASQILTQVTDYCTNDKFFSDEPTPYVAPESSRL